MSGVDTGGNRPAATLRDRRLWFSVAAATGAPVGAILVALGVYAVLVAAFGHTAVGGNWVLALLLAIPVGVVMMVAAPFVGARLSGHPRPMAAGGVAEVSALAAFLFIVVIDPFAATILASGLAAGLSIAYKNRGELLARGAVLIGFTILARAFGSISGFVLEIVWIVALLLVVPMTVAGGRALSLRGNKPKPPDEPHSFDESGIDPAGETVDLIVKLRGEGLGAVKIARELEKRGIKTATGKTTWNGPNVRQVLARELGDDGVGAEDESPAAEEPARHEDKPTENAQK